MHGFQNICLIGTGNLAYHLAYRFGEKNLPITQVYGRQIHKAQEIAQLCQASACDKLEDISTKADIYILAIKDDAIASFAQHLQKNYLSSSQTLVVHCSGAVPSTVLDIFPNYGVFYPLQSFSRYQTVNFEKLPFCIYANSASLEKKLSNLALEICPNVYSINDHQRKSLHVSAVLVNNFSNHLFRLAEDLCLKEEVDFNILKPLINNTVAKIQRQSPSLVQTGPAARKDLDTIAEHEALLKNHPNILPIYQLLSESILTMDKK